MSGEAHADWEDLLAAERHLQALVPDSVLVGGTAAALHARHRVSFDGDHVVADLRERFDEVLGDLEAAAGWVLAEVVERLGAARPVDVAVIDLASYRGLQPPWNDWHHVMTRGRMWARTLAGLLLGENEGSE